jgi:hypothetical protein
MSIRSLKPVLLALLAALCLVPALGAEEPKKEPAKAPPEAKAAEEAEAKRKAAEAEAKQKAEEAKRMAEEAARREKEQRAAVRIRANAAVVEVQAAPVPVPVQPAPAKREIFVPEPRGAGETLDDSAKAAKQGEGDTVTTVRGDRVVGKVLGIETGGKLRLTAPHFEGEVVVLASALSTVELLPSEKSSGGDEVALTNGDRIVGEVVGISPEAVIVDSKATGPLKVSRRIVEGIAFAQGRTMLLESQFAAGRMAPWTARGGGWNVVNGALQCESGGGQQVVFAKFEQKEPVTLEAKVESLAGRYVNCELMVFVDRTDEPYGRNSVIARFYQSQFNLMYSQDGGTNSVINRSMGTVPREGVFRLAYDPATAKARAWVDGNDLGEHTIPHKIAEGQFVMFGAQQPCRVTYLRVMRGIVTPSAAEAKTESKTHVVHFANKDRVAAEEIKLADGKLALTTSFGEIAAPVAKVQSIAFRSEALEKPRRNKGDVLVETADSRFTVQFERLTPEQLLGKSAYLGEVKVARSHLKRIRFNIYE